MAAKKRVGRPRNEQSRQAVLDAAHRLLLERGFGQITIEAVAAQAGVGKPTIYRYWSNSLELAMAAVMAGESHATHLTQETETGLTGLRLQLQDAVDRFNTPVGRQVTWLMAAAEQETELFKAFRNQVITRYRTEGRALLEQAIKAREVRADTVIDIALDMLYGPIFYRLLTRHAPLDRQFADELLDGVMSGIAS